MNGNLKKPDSGLSNCFAQNECQHAEAQSFLKRIYGGTMKSMLVHFFEEQSITEEEIKELRAILQEKSERDSARACGSQLHKNKY
ncbi:hypothetical protein J2TS4_25440 [Paenibacillus sp. J2TS4]|nr:hypothetical protein J2TS4_25440 [Paenibacillus sp. J2TS4]